MRERRYLARCVAALVAVTWGLAAATASAHAPHDVISDVAMSPGFASDTTVLAVSRGRVLRSEEGGSSWSEVTQGITGDAATRVVVAPSDPDRAYVLVRRGGVHRSDDQGRSWARTTGPDGQTEISDIVVSSASADLVYVVPTGGGLHRSTDGGGRWDRVGAFGEVTTLGTFGDSGVLVSDGQGVVHLSDDTGTTWRVVEGLGDGDPVTAFAATPGPDVEVFAGTSRGRLHRSTDGGASFEAVGSGLPSEPVASIAPSPEYGSDRTVWVSTTQVGTFRSSDGGGTFAERTTGLVDDPQADEMGEPDWTNLAVGRGAEGEMVLYLAGFSGLFRSSDGAERWSQVETLADFVTALAVSPDHANDGSLFAGTYVLGTAGSTDHGGTWQVRNDGLEVENSDSSVRRVHALAYSPDHVRDGTMFLTSTASVYVSTDRGESWTRSVVDAPYGADQPRFTIAVSPTYAEDRTVYLGARNGELLRSTSGGGSGSWELVANLGSKVRSIALHPSSATDGVMFASTLVHVVRSGDGGASWEVVLPVPASQLAISPDHANDGTVFAASARGLSVTRDGGATWTEVVVSPTSPGAGVEAVAVSPDFAVDRTVLVSLEGEGVFRSTDGGASYTFVGASLRDALVPVREFAAPTSSPIVFSPTYATDRTIYAFGANRVVRSTDGGTTWSVLGPVASAAPEAMPSELRDGSSPGSDRTAWVAGTAAVVALGLGALVLAARGRARRGGPAEPSDPR